nr:hypothetical protein [Pandoravirus massiliensis]
MWKIFKRKKKERVRVDACACLCRCVRAFLREAIRTCVCTRVRVVMMAYFSLALAVPARMLAFFFFIRFFVWCPYFPVVPPSHSAPADWSGMFSAFFFCAFPSYCG